MRETTKKNHEVIEIEPENTKPYTFRKLAAEDIFPMFTILNKIGMNEFKEFFEAGNLGRLVAASKGEAGSANMLESIGISVFFELASVVMNNMPKCEKEIFKMLDSVSDLSEAEIRKLDLATFTEMIIDFVKKEEFADFIKVVSKLFK